MKLPHVNKKQLPRIFVQTPFSHTNLKLEQKKFTPQKHSLFRSISCFGLTKITTPIWLQKSWKCVNRSKKNIARRIPETPRSENPFKRHPTTHQIKRAVTNLWLSWNKVMKQKSKNNKIKSVKIWLKIWSNFVIKWDPEKTISVKITSSKQLVVTKTTYGNFEKKYFRLNLWKKKLLKTTFTGKLEKVFQFI